MRLSDEQIAEEILKVEGLTQLLRERNESDATGEDMGLANVLEIMQEKLQACLGEFCSRAHDGNPFNTDDHESVLESFEKAINNLN